MIVRVDLPGRPYDIRIEAGALTRPESWAADFARDGRLLIVADEGVAERWLPPFLESFDCCVIRVPSGEASKSWTQLELVCEALLAAGVERQDHVVALGGGVVGDLAGLASALVNRGCKVVQVPTTLLSQVDSSVGGKTAINTRAGKNLVGLFHQPAHVLIDPDTLDTLPLRELRAGYAEVVKYGLIDDPAFFAWCEDHGASVIAGHAEARLHAIATSVRAKAAIVVEDERETSGRRALLNLGHTFGHALEGEAGYDGRLLHGEAVAAGMAIAFRYSVASGLCPAGDAERVARHLAEVGLPTTARGAGVDASGHALAAHMAHDKKRAGGRTPFLLARGIGKTFLSRDVDLAEVARFLDQDRG